MIERRNVWFVLAVWSVVELQPFHLFDRPVIQRIDTVMDWWWLVVAIIVVQWASDRCNSSTVSTKS